MKNLLLALSLALVSLTSARAWLADNGNGTFTNPLFYDEFSDPDLIRVGDDFYFTGATMSTKLWDGPPTSPNNRSDWQR